MSLIGSQGMGLGSVPEAGENGSIGKITSTGGTIAVTNPSGPVTNLEIVGSGVFPGFGGAPPHVASASAAGVSPTASRSDHTHAQDLSVVYVPSLVAAQATGVFQQTFSTPNATPTVTTFAAGDVAFGDPSTVGLVSHSANLNYTSTGTTQRLNIIVDGTTGGSTNHRGHMVAINPGGLTALLNYGAGYFTSLASNDITGLWTRYIQAGGANQLSIQIPFFNPTTSIPGIVKAAFNVGSFGTGANANGPGLFLDLLNIDIGLGSANQLAANATNGFVYFPRILPTLTGTPNPTAELNGRTPMVFEDTNRRLYEFNPLPAVSGGGAWHFAQFMDYDPGSNAGRIPFVGATAHTLTDSADFNFASATRLLTIGGTTAGHDGGLVINAQNAITGLNHSVPAGIHVADPFGAAQANVVADNFFYGNGLMGWGAAAGTDLLLIVAAGQVTRLQYNGGFVPAGGTDAMQIDGTSGTVSLGTLANGAGVTVTQNAGGADTLVGVATRVNASIHGYPYMPVTGTAPSGAADVYGNGAAAHAYDTTGHGIWVRNTVGAQWEFVPAANSTASAGGGAASIANLPASFGTTAKWWAFKGFGGLTCVVPYFTNP